MQTKPSKFWATITVIVGLLLMLSGLAAAVSFLGVPIFFPANDYLSDELGEIAGVFLGLFVGALLLGSALSPASAGDRLMEAKDIPAIRAAQDAQVSPDGRTVAFVVSEVDAPSMVGITRYFPYLRTRAYNEKMPPSPWLSAFSVR